MTKSQDLKNEIERFWKLKIAGIGQEIIGAMGKMKKNFMEILKTIPGNIITNELQLEVVRGTVRILKRTHGTQVGP